MTKEEQNTYNETDKNNNNNKLMNGIGRKVCIT